MAQPVREAFTLESARKTAELMAQRVAQFLTNSTMPLYFVDEVDQPCRDGSIVHTEVASTYLRNEAGRFEIVGVCRDITARKRTEAEQCRIENRRNRAQMLESLGILSGGIAHDFNNLLGGIFGYIDLAREKTREESVVGFLDKAMQTIDRARHLTGQLLTFSKGGSPLKNIEPLFPFIEESVRFVLKGAPVSSSFDIADGLWPCSIDRNQIGQVIENIIVNAQQAMPEGGIIEVSAQNLTVHEKNCQPLPPGEYVRISVKDHGIGIPKELLPRIFDPFFTTKTKGHGLGLATCYSIIKRHGGCIDVESAPGKGSTVHILLPASSDAARGAAATTE